MKNSPEPEKISWFLILSPFLSILSLLSLQMYCTSHWHHLQPDETIVTKISDLVPVDAWKLANVLLAVTAFGFAFARNPKGKGLLLRIVAFILATLTLLTVPLMT